MINWLDDKVYNLGKWEVHTSKAKKDAPVKWYLELHKDGHYLESWGSKMPFRWLAVWELLFRRRTNI